MNKKKILIFIDWFYPAFKAGGPIKSVSNIINSHSNQFDFSIITSSYDLNEPEPLKQIERNQWLKKNNYSIIYLDRDFQNKKNLLNLYREISPDLVYFNSLFSFKFTLLPLFILPKSQKKLLAPRGMLGKEALKIKGTKKKIFLNLMKWSKRLSYVNWHASTHLEKEEIEAVFGIKVKVWVAQNISSLAEKRPKEKSNKKVGQLKLLFFSRINEKKNILFALEVLKEVKDNRITLDIYGPIEDEAYWSACNKLIKENNLAVKYKGLLTPQDIPVSLWEYDYLFFPTKHENYGHVIAESLCSSLPVILSKNTPWLNLEEKKLGYDFDLKEKEKFVALLKTLKNQSTKEYQEFTESAFLFSKEKIVSHSVIEENYKMFTNA